MYSRVSQNVPKCIVASDIVHMAASIPQEPPKKIHEFKGIFVEWPPFLAAISSSIRDNVSLSVCLSFATSFKNSLKALIYVLVILKGYKT